jgi:hypothetical protein
MDNLLNHKRGGSIDAAERSGLSYELIVSILDGWIASYESGTQLDDHTMFALGYWISELGIPARVPATLLTELAMLGYLTGGRYANGEIRYTRLD